MASMKFSLVLLLACTLSLQGVVLAEIICEDLSANLCAFSVSSSAKRCVLENSITDGGKVEYRCKTSEVVVGSSTAEYLETDECVSACGVDRKAVGMSSDALLDPTFTSKLCSSACYNNCPNIVELYFNLASGEGVFLPDMCQKKRGGAAVEIIQSDEGAVSPAAAATRRGMAELLSSGAVADAPSQPRRGMVELLSSGGAVAEAPTQPRRGMVELLSSGAAAPSPIPSDDPLFDTPSTLYFY